MPVPEPQGPPVPHQWAPALGFPGHTGAGAFLTGDTRGYEGTESQCCDRQNVSHVLHYRH